MGQLIVKSIGSGPNDDYPDLATWWNAQRGDIAASGIISIAELSGEEFVTSSIALDMQADQANTSPFAYYIIRAKRPNRWKGYLDGTEVGSEVARLDINNTYGIKCDVPYTRFEGFAIKNVSSTTDSNRELAGIKINADNVTIDGLLIFNCVLTPDLNGNTVTIDSASSYGIYTFKNNINILNTTIGNVSCADDGGPGDKNTIANAYGVFGTANVINCSIFNIFSSVASQTGVNPNTANAYGLYVSSGTIQNNIVWDITASSPDGPETANCYHFGSSSIHANNVADDATTASDTNGIINFDPSNHFKTVGGSVFNLTSKSNTPLATSGVVQTSFFWDFEGQPRLVTWTTGHDQIGSGISNNISHVPLVCLNRIPETVTNVWFGDSFNQATLGNSWLGNAWTIQDNKLKQNLVAGEYVVVSGSYTYNQDVVFNAIASGLSVGQEQGMYLRYVDSTNYLRLSWQPGLDFFDLRGFVGGSQVFFDSQTVNSDIFLNNINYNIQTSLIEDQLNIFINGAKELTFTLDSSVSSLKTNSTVGFVSINTDSNRTFFIDDFSLNSRMLPLYIKGSGDEINSSIPLYLNAVSGLYSVLPLYLFSAETPVSGQIPLYLFGVSGVSSNNVPLFISSDGSGNNSLPLFILGPMQSTNSIPLILQGHELISTEDSMGRSLYEDFSSGLGNWTPQTSGNWTTYNNKAHFVEQGYTNSFLLNNTSPPTQNNRVSVIISASGSKTAYNGRRSGLISHYLDNNNYYNLWLSYQNIGQDTTLISFLAKKNGSTIAPYTVRIYEDLIEQGHKWGFTVFRDGRVYIYKDNDLFHSFVLNANYVIGSVGSNGLGVITQTSPYLLYDDFEITPCEFDLYIAGHIQSSGSLPLYLETTSIPSNSLPLYIGSLSSSQAFIPLYLDSGEFTAASGSLALSIFAGTSGQFNSVPLFLQGLPLSGVYNSDLELFIAAPSTGVKQGNLTLSLTGGTYSTNKALPLILHNHGVGSGLNLFIQGLSLSGADNSAGIPLTSSIPLFIARNENTIIPLYISGHNPYMSGGITLFTVGASGIINNNIPMYLYGVFTNNDNINLYTHGF